MGWATKYQGLVTPRPRNYSHLPPSIDVFPTKNTRVNWSIFIKFVCFPVCFCRSSNLHVMRSRCVWLADVLQGIRNPRRCSAWTRGGPCSCGQWSRLRNGAWAKGGCDEVRTQNGSKELWGLTSRIGIEPSNHKIWDLTIKNTDLTIWDSTIKMFQD